jgi:hypothetical protein
MRNNADVTSGKRRLIAVYLRFSGVSAVNPLVAFYYIHRKKGEVLFFCFVADTTRSLSNAIAYINTYHSQFIPEGIPETFQIFF